MATSEFFQRTVTVSTTELSLTAAVAGPRSETAVGVFECEIDLSAMAAGDKFQFKGYEKTASGGTQRAFLDVTFSGKQSQNALSRARIMLHGWDYTIKKIAGTDRSVVASVRQA